MTFSKRRFLQLAAIHLAALALVACGGGGGDTAATGGTGGTGGSGGTGGTGALVITGTSNIPDAGTNIVPDAGLPSSGSTVVTSTNLLNVAINSLVNSNLRFFTVPLAGTAPPAINSSYAIVIDGATSGSALVLTVTNALTAKTYSFSSESGTVKITALSATSIDLLFTNVTLHPTPNADPAGAFATGKVILNGTVTLPRR